MSSEWAAIETAPISEPPGYKSYFLYWNGYHRGVGFRIPPDIELDPNGIEDFCDEIGEFIVPRPTHWMPLPPPPAPIED